MLPPTRRVAAIKARAVRDRVRVPGTTLLAFNIKLVPQIVLPHAWQMEPPSQFQWVPFGDAMRHELGSKDGFCPADISCYWEQLIKQCSVILSINEILTTSLLIITY